MKKVLSFGLCLVCAFALSISVCAAAPPISFEGSVRALEVGKKTTLKINGNTKGKTVTFSSSDTKILTVSATGTVTAVAPGRAKVTAAVKGVGKLTRTFKITAIPSAPSPEEKPAIKDLTASELVSQIKIGWNLGNTFDAYGIEKWTDMDDVIAAETAWLGGKTHKTTKKLFEKLKADGFNAVRIPTTWSKYADDGGNIDEKWIARVKEVVDLAISLDMYVILNSHHDKEFFLTYDEDMPKTKARFKRVWEQISEVFKDYGERLIFEALNEPTDIRNPNVEWSGGTKEVRENVNTLNSLFVETVRASGGNNAYRILMVPTYGASTGQTELDAFKMPLDTVKDKLIVSVHSYSPYNFALNYKTWNVKEWSSEKASDTREITSAIDRVYDKFVSNGVPVIMGEMGALNKDNLEARADWAEFYISYAKSKGIPCFWWDNLASEVSGAETGECFGLYTRNTAECMFPKILEALMKGLEK